MLSLSFISALFQHGMEVRLPQVTPIASCAHLKGIWFFLFSAPLQICGILYFLWQIMGPSVLAGLFVMIMMIPVNVVTAAKARKLQTAQMKEKDNRVKMMNEILQGVKVGLAHWASMVRSIICPSLDT